MFLNNSVSQSVPLQATSPNIPNTPSFKMNKFIILVTLAAAVVAEPPVSGGYSGGGGSVTASRNFGGNSGGGGGGGSGINEYVDQALLDRVAALISSGGSPSQQDNEGSQYVDESIFTRVASSLGDSGSSRGVSSEYGAPAPGGSASLGNPEPAQRIAEFDLATETRQSGGYQQQQQAPQQGYGAPAQQQQQSSGGYDAPQRSSGGVSGGAISFGQPETAQRVAEFDVSGQQGGSRSQGGQGGYN